jgi:hypothetical protein
MNDHQQEEPQDTSPDRRSESTKKWVEHRREVDRARAVDNARAAMAARMRHQELRLGYQSPRGVWVGLILVAILLVAGLWIVDSLHCDPLASDIALLKKDACR